MLALLINQPQGSHGLIAVVIRTRISGWRWRHEPQGSHGLIAVVIGDEIYGIRPPYWLAAREPRPDSRGNNQV